MRNFPLFLGFLLVLPATAAPPGYKGPKERGAIYVRDFLEEDEKVKLKVLRATPVFSTKDATGVLGTLDGNQEADLEGISTFSLRVRGKGTNGHIVGWVNPRDLEAADPELLPTLRKMAERREQVLKLIEAKQVALGMTASEVAEAWGQPTKQESRLTAEGRMELMEYIEYELIPRYEYVRDPVTGATYRRFTYNEKIEKGKNTVELKDGVVTAISEKKDNSRRRELLTVPAPLVWSW